ncbi:MAG: BatA domain-containing protein [Owenweeksia sp.]|nr:BatA domain-containing protein [Owenweeksia sp.]
MKFLYPQFLWALLALAVPLIIHLFNFRRYTTLYFSDTRFLKNVVKQSKAINRLRQLLIMLARMLALAALVLAFANPYLPAADSVEKPGNYASIYIDNSPSMQSGPQQSSLISKAREQAIEIIKGLPRQFKVQILTNDFSGRQQRFYSKTAAIEMVDEIKPSYAFRNAKAIIAKMQAAAQDQDINQLESFFISDFQTSAFSDIPSLPADWRVNLLPITKEEGGYNISIDSLWFKNPVLQPGFDHELIIKLGHSGAAQTREVPVNLKIGNDLQGARKVKVPANASAQVSFTIRSEAAASYQGHIAIDAGSPYFDNKFFFSYSVAEPFKVLLTGSNNRTNRFAQLFSDSIFQFSYAAITALDYSQLSNLDLIILEAPENIPSGLIQSLQKNLEMGKNVALLPSATNPEALNELLLNLQLPTLSAAQGSAKALEVQWDDPQFRDVFTSTPERPSLPTVEKYYAYSRSKGYPLISLENGSPLVSRLPVGKAMCF